ncbi:MAG: oxidoreductase [Pseudomonadota bacterium]
MFAKLRIACVAAVVLASPASAEDVILTVSGAVEVSSESDSWTFDLDALRAMPVESFETTTIWTEGAQTFEGVPLVALLDHVGAAEGTLRAIALNDYAVTIPTTDAVENGPIVAYSRDGEEMSVRDKGPLWIIYPFDDNETYQSEDYYSRSIWQLDRIEVVEK